MKLAITGANSSVGINLLQHLTDHDQIEPVACVRSESAQNKLPEVDRANAKIIDFSDSVSLEQAFSDCDCVIHLAGILIETKHSNYATANVAATEAVAQAAKLAGVKHIVFISVVGADANASNAYFRSKGTAEKVLAGSGIGVTNLRTPILMGPGSAGAWSLLNAAGSDQAKVLGGGTYQMRPLDLDDLSQALIKLSQDSVDGARTYELVGPEAIAYRDLIQKTAQLMGKSVTIASVPIWPAKLGAAITSVIKGGGITPTVIDVITSDERVDSNSDANIGIELTPLEQTLQKIIAASQSK